MPCLCTINDLPMITAVMTRRMILLLLWNVINLAMNYSRLTMDAMNLTNKVEGYITSKLNEIRAIIISASLLNYFLKINIMLIVVVISTYDPTYLQKDQHLRKIPETRRLDLYNQKIVSI